MDLHLLGTKFKFDIILDTTGYAKTTATYFLCKLKLSNSIFSEYVQSPTKPSLLQTHHFTLRECSLVLYDLFVALEYSPSIPG